jgi:predicted transposase YbfD/YdcC
VTGDALYCQRKLCSQIVAAKGHYLVIVKENQKHLYQDIELLFDNPPPGEAFVTAEGTRHCGVEQWEKHGDRIEVRRLWASTALRGYLDWPGVQQVIKVERVSRRKGKVSSQVRYAITSLDERTSASQLLRQVRGHWGIENRLHYVRDVTFGEDCKCSERHGSQVRSGAALRLLGVHHNEN